MCFRILGVIVNPIRGTSTLEGLFGGVCYVLLSKCVSHVSIWVSRVSQGIRRVLYKKKAILYAFGKVTFLKIIVTISFISSLYGSQVT